MEDAAQNDNPDHFGEELAAAAVALVDDAAGPEPARPIADGDLAPEVAPEAEALAPAAVQVVDEPICVICQHALRPTPPAEQHDLEALVCGHVHHKVCLERWWNIRGIARGRCPICQVDPQAGQQQLERLLGEVIAPDPQPDVLV